ncbi:MAG: IS1 family transposase [Microscillaceae bacterium]|nr:IS1 family transposase [Microscillaceae bacterium]
MKHPVCPKCGSDKATKSGIIRERQRYRCKTCDYYFTVNKLGKQIDNYYVIKALQLYIEGISYREIERLLGVSHVSVMNWVKKYRIQAPENSEYHPTYKILNHNELVEYLAKSDQLKGSGMIITELGDKFMMIKWERFRE